MENTETKSRVGPQANAAMEGIAPALTDHIVKGRPKYHTGDFIKQTIVLTEADKDFLEDILMTMKSNSRQTRGKGKGKEKFTLDVSKFIRASLTAVRMSHCGLDRKVIRNENQLATYLLTIMVNGMKAG